MTKIISIDTYGNTKDQEWEMGEREITSGGLIKLTLTNVKTRQMLEGYIKSFTSSGKYEIEVEDKP